MQPGKLEGKLEGQQEAAGHRLQRPLIRRFGLPRADSLARLRNATRESLEQWTEDIRDAATLDDVFKNH